MPTQKLCFVIGPIGKPASDQRRHADWLLKAIIKPVFKEFFPQYDVVRADEIKQQGNIGSQVINRLFDAHLVIADMSLANANAFYELAIRHMKRLPTIHMIKNDEEIPFDVLPYRAIKFAYDDPVDVEAAISELRSVVEETIKDGFVVENPITHARGRLEFEEHATPAMKLLSEEIDSLKARMTSIETDIKPATPSRISRSRAQVTRRVRVVHDSALDRGALTQELVRHANVVAIHWEDIDTASVVFTATDDEVDEVIRRFRTISGISEVDRI